MLKPLKALLLFMTLLPPAQAQPACPPAPHSTEEVCWEIVTDIYIGVQTERLSPEEREAYKDILGPHRVRRQGLRVKRVLPDSPAEKGGLKAGDLILKQSGCSIASMEDLLLSMRNVRPGQLVHFSILRDGKQMPLSFRVGGLPQPVVVAHARLLRENEDQPGWHPGAGPKDENPQDQGLSPQEAMTAKQGRIARMLAAETPDLQAVRREIRDLNALFPDFARAGQVRLYYETEFGYVTVTCFQKGITVTVQSEQEMQAYELAQPGDALPESLRRIFSKL